MSRLMSDFASEEVKLGWFQRIVFGYLAVTLGIMIWGIGLYLLHYFMWEVLGAEKTHLVPALLVVFVYAGLHIVATVGFYRLFKALYLRRKRERLRPTEHN